MSFTILQKVGSGYKEILLNRGSETENVDVF